MLTDQYNPSLDSNKQSLMEKSEPPPSYPCQHNKNYIIIKRIIDIIVSLMLLICLSPLFLLCSILIKIESPGPVLYRQKRVGKDGRLFTFLKFRTMKSITDKEEEAYIREIIELRLQISHAAIVYKIHNNPRLTPIGRFLRKTSLDEIAQILNVLKGDMSFVGPRPPIPFEFKVYKESYRERLKCKPGITGLWQVSGGIDDTLEGRYRLDIQYMKEFSPWLDLKILFKTVYAVLKGSNF